MQASQNTMKNFIGAREWEKAKPILGLFGTHILPHVGSFHSPTWGFQKHNSYRVGRTSCLQEANHE